MSIAYASWKGGRDYSRNMGWVKSLTMIFLTDRGENCTLLRTAPDGRAKRELIMSCRHYQIAIHNTT
jgi:hypothetical protein